MPYVYSKRQLSVFSTKHRSVSDEYMLINSEWGSRGCDRVSLHVYHNGMSHITDSELAINLENTNIIKLKRNSSPQHPLNTGYDEKHTDQRGNTKFLGLQTVSI